MARGDLRGEKVFLRPLATRDGPSLDRVLRDGRATRMLPPRVRRESGPEFVRRVRREARSGDGLCFAVVPVGGTEAVGQIRLFDRSRLEGRAEVGYWIRRRCWGEGYGTEALALLCRYGFRTWRLHRIVAHVVVDNAASIRVLEKAGFRREGRMRGDARVGARWTDTFVFGLLAGELRSPPAPGADARHPRSR